MSQPFVHLRVRSPYSLLRGAMRIPTLLERCAAYAMPAVAISDYDNLFGSLEFSQSAMRAGVQPIIATTVSVKPISEAGGSHRRAQPDELLLIAKDKTGYHNLIRLSSLSHISPEGGEGPLLSYDTICQHADGIIALSAGIHGGIGRALLHGRNGDAQALLEQLQNAFDDRLYIELMRHGLSEEKQIEAPAIELAMTHGIPLVATNHVFFDKAEHFEAHDALLCVAEGRYVSESERLRLNPEFRLKSPEEMRLLFADLPEALANSVQIARRCSTFSPSRDPILPSFHMEDEEGRVLNETEALKRRAHEGLEARLKAHVFTEEMDEAARAEVAKPYIERLDYELDVIITMKFPGYFLIVSDFITWAKEHDIPVGPGRGSGAGSLVAWSLLITDLDPLRFGLIFERFLNPERVSMPDFDIDFCQERRDEVIRYVQQKYGHDKVAQIITFGKLQARAVLRDVGRVLQMPYGQVDKICKLVPANPANPVTLEQALDLEPELKRQMQQEEVVDQLVKLSLQLEGLYRHASTHAAGVVIADRKLDELVPVYRDPKSDMPVTQYSMKYAEGAGLVKFDFLGLKTLTVLQRTLELLKPRGIEIDLSTLPFDDAKTYELCSKGQTIGVFQFESAGMQDALRKLKPDCLEDLIALGALYRPGPMDNIPTYIARKHGKEKPDYLHPMLTDVLRETYGVIIYQEQVQKIAQVMANYTLGGADLLRRAMGKKIKSEMDAQREMFTNGALENGVSKKQASEIFDLVAKFAGYGFNKSHAAAYAVIAYQTAYLKANYPVEFLAASMAYDMHSTDKLSIFRQEALSMGIETLPPDVNKSEVMFSVEHCQEPAKAVNHLGESLRSKATAPQKLDRSGTDRQIVGDKLAIRYALAAIKNVGGQAMAALVAERKQNGAFKDVFDFAERMDASVMNRRQLEHLVMAGAFDSLHPNRRQLFESIDRLMGINSAATRERDSSQNSLFGMMEETTSAHHRLPEMSDWPALERLHHEFSAIGFYLSAHPLDGYESQFEQANVVPIAWLEEKLEASYKTVKIAGIVTGKKVKVSPKGKFAFVSVSDASGITEFSVFNEGLLSDASDLLEAGQMVLVRADGKREEGGVRLIAQSIEPLDELHKHQKDSCLEVEMAAIEAAPRLKDVLGEPKEQASRVVIYLNLPGHRARVLLPQRYALSPEKLSELQAMQGVTRAELK